MFDRTERGLCLIIEPEKDGCEIGLAVAAVLAVEALKSLRDVPLIF